MSVRVTGQRGLAKVSESLRRLANGAAAPLAARDGAAILQKAMEPVLAKHVKTGKAQSTSQATAETRTITVQFPAYLRFHPNWWFFSRGVPRYLLRRVAGRYKAHSNAIVRGAREAGAE